MWPFRRRRDKEKKKNRHIVEKVIAGVIIGTAVSSIIGKKMLDKHERDKAARKDDEE